MIETKFRIFQFKPFIYEALQKIGFYEPTEIQEQFIPVVLKGKVPLASHRQEPVKPTHIYCRFLT